MKKRKLYDLHIDLCILHITYHNFIRLLNVVLLSVCEVHPVPVTVRLTSFTKRQIFAEHMVNLLCFGGEGGDRRKVLG